MERFSRMLRSGLAMVLAICMIIGACPTVAFANETTKKYVSLGDSMTNGYGLTGYDAHGSNGFLEVANESYPALVADHYDWDLTQLATSAMRVEDLNYILGGSFAGDWWTEDELLTNDDRWGSEWALQHGVQSTFVNSVTNADVITMAAGNGNFGVFLLGRITNALGLFGSAEEDAWINFEDALANLDAESKAAVMSMYNKVLDYAKGKLPASLAEPLTKAVGYTLVSFVLNYSDTLDRIVELNPDAEIIIVGLMNTMSGYELNIEYQGKTYTINMEQILNLLLQPLNAYLATMPAVKQELGQYAEAKIYYTDVDTIAVMSQSYRTLYKQNGGNNTVRDRFVKGIANFVGGLMGNEGLKNLKLSDVLAYEANPVDYAATNKEGAATVAMYLGLEEAVLKALETEDLTFSLDDIMNSAAGDADAFLGNVLGNVMTEIQNKVPTNAAAKASEAMSAVAAAKDITVEQLQIAYQNDATTKAAVDGYAALLATPETIVETMTENDMVLALLNLYGRLKMGDGLSAHPSAIGHADLAGAIISAYDSNNTVQEEVKQNIKYALGEMKGFLETYGPDAVDQLVKVWNENGYQAIVDETVTELEETLTARYDHYKNNVLPALTTTTDALTAQKAELTAQLTTLNAQLAAKKAELEKVISEQEIGSIYTPDINIDTELGNNEQTEVPENDCEGAGNVADELAAAVADLEHAIAVVEALIADVSADIDDMVALATEIAEAIAELEKTVDSVAAAAMDLKDAFDAVYAILTDENADATAQSFINVFNTAREAALTAADALELVVETATDDVAAIDASITALTEGVDALYANFDPAHAESALQGVISVLPEEVVGAAGAAALIMQELGIDKQDVLDALEIAKTEVTNKLTEDLTALEAEYHDDIVAAAQAVEAKKNEMQAAITAEYAEYEQKAIAEIDALNTAAQKKLDELNTRLAGYQAELANAAEDAIEGIQAQIDRVNADIAKVNEDLACAVEHVNTELQAKYDEIVAKVTPEFEAIIADLQKIHDDLVNEYNTAVENLKAAADKAIEDLTAAADKEIQALIDAANKKIEELGDISDEIKESINNIYQAIRDDVSAAQNAINDILHGDLNAIEDLKEALNDLGLAGVAALVDELTSLIEDLIHQATYADLNVDDGFLYIALGDDTALSEGYVELVAEKIEEEKNLEDGVDILFKNYAKAGNTIAKERKNLSDVADADLITIGFGNVNMLKTAVDAALSKKAVSYDWAGLVGNDLVPYVEDALAEVYAEIDATIADVDMNAAAKAAVASIAYSSVEYAVELPQLIAEIREVNEDALIIIVGQYNPMNGAVLDLMGNTMDLNEYIEYFVDAVAVHGIAYSLVSGDAIFAEAPDVDTEEFDSKWSVLDLATMLQNGFATLNPSDAGDVYIANQILKALNITQLNELPVPFFKDVFADDYYYEAVKWAVKMGITTGTQDGTIFEPNSGCTRAHVVTFLWRAAGCPEPESTVMPFTDVPTDDYFTDAVLWAAENGITKGTGDGTTFEPHVTCSRAQIVTMLSRYLNGKPSSNNNPFVDVPNDYYTDAVIWAAENGITTGTGDGTTFEPHATCTRGQIVTFLFRALYQHR